MAIKTYQDLVNAGQAEDKRMQFVKTAIVAHKSSSLYQTACIAHQYDMQRNTTICTFQKLLYKVSGEAVPDNYSANYKLCSNFFHRLITQLVEFELGNGVSWGKPSRKISETTANKYSSDEVYMQEVWNPKAEMYVPQWFMAGTDKKVGEDFDQRLQELVSEAFVGSVAFGFWNYDHLEVFNIREFVPLYDEENGALMAGIRFWQISPDKPLRATLYEVDGITDYQCIKSKWSVLEDKHGYLQTITKSETDGEHKIYAGENYEGFPIIPLWVNKFKTSAIIGLRENIDCFDLIKSGYANTVDDASLIYWTLNNAGGMDEVDLAKFVDQIRRVKVGLVDDNEAKAEAHTMDVPYASREAILTRLRSDIYEDFMAVDTKNIASGAITATQIQASYEPMNAKADELEFCILDFLQNMLKIAGIDDKATFTRSVVVNKQEEVTILLQGANYLPEEYVTQRLLTLFGDGDAYDEIQRKKDEEDMARMPMSYDDDDDDTDTEEDEETAPEQE